MKNTEAVSIVSTSLVVFQRTCLRLCVFIHHISPLISHTRAHKAKNVQVVSTLLLGTFTVARQIHSSSFIFSPDFHFAPASAASPEPLGNTSTDKGQF